MHMNSGWFRGALNIRPSKLLGIAAKGLAQAVQFRQLGD